MMIKRQPTHFPFLFSEQYVSPFYFLKKVGELVGVCLVLLLISSPTSAEEYETESAAVTDTVFITEDGDTIKSSELDSLQRAFAIAKLPVLLEFVKAVYPPAALKEGREGEVTFELFVSDSGIVDSVVIAKGLQPDLDSAAIEAVKAFRFKPAIAGGGMSVPVIVEYVYRFSIAEEIKDIEEFVNLQGRIMEKGTRLPVRDAPVILTFLTPGADTAIKVPWEAYLKKMGSFQGQKLEGDRLSTITDSEGRFFFKSLPSGSVRILFLISGYKSDSVDEVVTRDVMLESEYRIEPLVTDEYEIVVYGRIEKKEVAKSSLSLTEVKRIPGFGGDAVKVVQALPGVARASFGSGQIVVRGSASGDTRYFLDGIEIPLLFHFGGLRSTYNSDALSSIDLYPGGFNTRYGGCIGGVVEIKGRPATLEGWHGNVDISLIDASMLAEGKLAKNLSLMLTGRRSYLADVATWFIKQAGITLPLTVVPYYWDGVARLDYKISNTSRMFLTGFFGQDSFRFVISEVRGGNSDVSEDKEALSQSIGFRKGIFGWDQDIKSYLRNELRIAYGINPVSFNVFSFVRFQSGSNSIYVRDELVYEASEKAAVRAGVDILTDSIDYKIRILGAAGAVATRQRNLYGDIGIYSGIEYKPFKELTINPGLRFDYYPEVSEGLPAIRLTTKWNYARNGIVKAAFGTYNQTPQPRGQALDTAWGNPDMVPTTAQHAVFGHEWQISDLVSLDVQSYYNHQNKIPLSASDSVNPSTGKPYNFIQDQEGRMYGLEVMLRHNQGKRFFGWLAYSLSRSERRSDRRPSDQGGGNSSLNSQRSWDSSKWYLFSRDQTHNLQLVGSWKLIKGFEAGGRLRYVTGNPATPNLGYTELRQEYNTEWFDYRTLYGEPLSDRMGPFFQLDIRVDKRWLFDKWNLSVYLDVQNVNYFFYNSPERYTYSYDGSERTTVGGIVIPSLGLRAEF